MGLKLMHASSSLFTSSLLNTPSLLQHKHKVKVSFFKLTAKNSNIFYINDVQKKILNGKNHQILDLTRNLPHVKAFYNKEAREIQQPL